MLYLAARVRTLREPFDMFFCDLVAHTVPVLKLSSPKPVVFYCHHPDSLLATQRGGLYRLYRWPIDWTEQHSMARADKVLVNSRFTAQVLADTLPLVGAADVVYPGVPVEGSATHAADIETDTFNVLCFSRYERKKNVLLAIDTLTALRALLPAAELARVRLVIAGGYDARLRDNREVFEELELRARESGLGAQIRFVRSPDDAQRDALLHGCQCLLFTAENEHFGYVPVEAMAAGKPVISAASGGPLETIEDGETGFLCAPEATLFAQRLAQLAQQPALCRRLGDNGRRRVEQRFSRRAFAGRLASIVESVAAAQARSGSARR
jgi:alpha-1,3/alpha-1,6-mannosyltransferase